MNTGAREMSMLTGSPGDTPSSAPAASSEGSHWETLHPWPPWVYLALAAFAFCALEWWGFHRRRTE